MATNKEITNTLIHISLLHDRKKDIYMAGRRQGNNIHLGILIVKLTNVPLSWQHE